MKQIQKGLFIQVYRGAIHASSHADAVNQLEAKLILFKTLGITGVLMHGFTSEMDTAKFKELADLCHKHGLLCYAAYGLDSSDPVGKGQRMGKVAAMPECDALVLDMEGAWENEAIDKANAVAMGAQIRKLAPNVMIYDQPWPVPTYHWSGFPWEETAAYVDARAAQWYFNDWKSQYGTARYAKCSGWFTDSWTKLDQRLAPKGLVRPEIKTIQGYGWDDILSDLVNCLTTEETLFVWCEPWPSDTFLKAVRIKNELARRGFTGPQAVLNFQKSTNGKLKADNIAGPKTLLELGF